jgi:tyrosyl-tRNA synthetase
MMSTSSSPASAAAPPRLPPVEACAQLCADTAQVINRPELLEKLRSPSPLRVKLGVDPTTPDLHLGHALALDKMRQFQDLGHTGILIIGDFTAMIGDPSGRSVTRPALSHEEVMANAETYQRQAYKVLDPARTKVVFNGEWFELMHYEEIIRLNSRVTLQQILQREDFKQRIADETPVSLHELQYPLLQGWDSVMIQADVELGGTDQLFNILVGRDLQKQEGLPPQIVMTVPILEGLDGVQKMSKSLKNYIGLAEPPGEMFGKAMSISDALMERYYPVLLREPYPTTAHPMEAKKALAARLVARYHSEAEARTAREDFEHRFSQRDLASADLPVVTTAGIAADIVSLVIAAYAQGYGQTKSRGEVRRLVEGGSIQHRGEKVTDFKSEPPLRVGDVLKLDKKRAVRIGK